MSHRHLHTIERQGDALSLTCPYAVDVVQAEPGIDDRNAQPWSRLFLMHPEGPAADDAVTDVVARRRHPLRPGVALLLPPDRLYGFRFHPGMRMIAMHFRLEWAPGCDVFAGRSACIALPDATDPIRRAYAALAAGEDVRAAVALRGTLMLLAGPCIGSLHPLPPRLRTVLDRIEADCRADLAVGELAALAGLSRERVRRVFRSVVGVPPMEHIRRRVTTRACALLLEGLQVQEVAERLRFSSPFWFSRFFRDRLGVPPSRFRIDAGGMNPGWSARPPQ